MTKISFDLDFNKDSETLLREIQDQAKAEVEKREGKERAKAYLSNLHESVNEKIGTSYNSVTELVRALAEHASPAMRERISGSTAIATGRRKTVSMNRELYEQIKEALAKPSPNKAAIARETNVSVVQVRKVAEGGYDEKFGGSSVESIASDSKPVELASIDIPSPEPEVETLASLPESLEIDLPPPAEIPEPENDPVIEESTDASADFDEDEEDTTTPDATDSIMPDLPPPPSFNDENEEANADDEMQLPPPDLPPIAEDLPNALEPPVPPPSFGGETDSPPTSPSPPTPAADAEEDGATATSPLGKKLGLKLGGKPTLNITRPPMPKSLPPTPAS